MHTGKVMRAAAVAALLGSAVLACDGEAARTAAARAERAAIAQSESTVTRGPALARTGRWSEAHLLDRLVRAGVAPRPLPDADPGPEWFKVRPVVYAAGGGEVRAWIYPDSVARRAVTDGLDPLTAAPVGRSAPYAGPMRFVVQNNLAAVIVGGTETNQDRIALALQAGLPAAGTDR